MRKRIDIWIIALIWVLGGCGGDSYEHWDDSRMYFEYTYKDGSGNLRETTVLVDRVLVEETDISKFRFEGMADIAILDTKYLLKFPRTFYVVESGGVALYKSNNCAAESPCIRITVIAVGQTAFGVEKTQRFELILQYSYPEGRYVKH